jgi:aldose 1-epimerase
MTVKGKNVLQFPYASEEAYVKGPVRGMSGIPFLAPWANRLDEPAFYANGKKYSFNLQLGNVRPNQAGIRSTAFSPTQPSGRWWKRRPTRRRRG